MYRAKYIIIRAAFITALFIAAACARTGSPSGGPKDVDPPVILKSSPPNESVLFSEKSFTITFDEFVVLDKITEKFMVSPPMEEKPEIKIRGKELIVSWEEDLLDSTTYTFYFQDAIRDNNENNPIPNYQYVFSTGSFLDSLSLSGNVFSASDLEATKDMMVMMYSNLSDTAPRTTLPAYISRPDASGGFVINNIKPGRYKLYALGDMNGNKLYDLENEPFGFYDSLIVVTPEDNAVPVLDSMSFTSANEPEKAPAAAPAQTSTKTTKKPAIYTFGRYRIYTFTPESKKQYLKFSERKSAGSLSFGLALPSDSGQVAVTIADVPDEAWYLEHNTPRDTFYLWIKEQDVYSREFLEAIVSYPFTDSTGMIISKTDTLAMRYIVSAGARAGIRRPVKSVTTNLKEKIRPGTRGYLMSTTPLLPPDTAKMTLTQRVDTVNVRRKLMITADTSNSRRYFLENKFEPGNAYTLICRKGAFRDIYGVESDSTVYKFSVNTPEDYGSVVMLLSGYEGEVIVQLLNEKKEVVREVKTTSPGKSAFELLNPGKYTLRVIYDLDNNGEWTTGNYSLHLQPEPVTYYEAEMDAKINWVIEQDWDISMKYVKEISLRSKLETKK